MPDRPSSPRARHVHHVRAAFAWSLRRLDCRPRLGYVASHFRVPLTGVGAVAELDLRRGTLAVRLQIRFLCPILRFAPQYVHRAVPPSPSTTPTRFRAPRTALAATRCA